MVACTVFGTFLSTTCLSGILQCILTNSLILADWNGVLDFMIDSSPHQ